MPSLLIRPVFSRKIANYLCSPRCLLDTISTTNDRLKEDMRLNMSSLVRFGKVLEKTTESNIVLAKLHTDAILIFINADVKNYFTVFMLILCQQF